MQTLAPVPQPQPIEQRRPRALEIMANRLNVDPGKMLEALRATVFKNATNEEMLALVVTSNEYGLNPFLREIYAFPGRQGGIVPIVSVDGWIRIVNRQPQFDGVDFSMDLDQDGRPIACSATIYRKDRSHPTIVTEYASECSRNTDPWNKMPSRMLRHKAFVQAARLAFGLSGLYDEDEARDFGVQLAASRPITVPDFSVQAPAPGPETTTATVTPPQDAKKRRGRPPKHVEVTSPPSEEPTPPAETPAPESPAGETRTPQQELIATLSDQGVSFDDAMAVSKARYGNDFKDADSWDGWETIPTPAAVKMLGDRELLAKLVKLFAKAS